MLDRYGPRVSSVVGTVLVTAGIFLFAVSDSKTFDAFIPAFFLIGFGSPGPHLASLHVSNLFPSRARSVVTLYSANYSLSGIVFVIFLWISDAAAITVRQLFLGYGALLCVVLVSVPMVQPWKTFVRGDRVAWHWRSFTYRVVAVDPAAAVVTTPASQAVTAAPDDGVALLAAAAADRHEDPADPDADDEEDTNDGTAGRKRSPSGAQLLVAPAPGAREVGADSGSAADEDGPAKPGPLLDTPAFVVAEDDGPLEQMDLEEPGPVAAPPLKERTLWRQLRSAEFAGIALFLVTLNSDLQFYVATIRAQTVLLGDSAASGYVYTQVFIVVGAVGFVAFPLISYTLERRGFPVSFATVAVLIALSNVLALVPSLQAQYATFLFWSTGRFALFAAYFAYLPEAFGFRYFGTVNGILSVLLATSALLPYPLTLLVLNVFGGQYWPINVAFLVVVLVTGSLYPLWLHRRTRRAAA